MLKGSISNKQMLMMQQLLERGRCDSLKDLCYGITLEWFQTLMVAWILIMRKFICTLDTGLGKTIIASAVMRWLYNSGETKKFLYIAENGGLKQTAKKLSEYTGLTVKTCNATEEEGLKLFESEDFNILLISYQAIQSYPVTVYLIQHISEFDTLILDECQWVSELNDSNTWNIMCEMRQYFRDIIMFSATPFKTNPLQLLKQVELMDNTIIGNINAYIKDKVTRSVMYEIVDWHGLDRIREDLTLYVNGFSREELGIGINYNPFAHVVEATDEQKDVIPQEMYAIKSDAGGKAVQKLLEIVNDSIMEFKQGIIYCSTNVNKQMLLNVLRDNFITCDIIDGSISDKKQRDAVQQRYVNGEIQVLIINITTTLDLPSNYCIFYELCDAGTITQFIGRCVRGLGDSELDVHFILTEDTYEIDYFFNSIYKKSTYLQKVLGKDDKLMKAIRKQVKEQI